MKHTLIILFILFGHRSNSQQKVEIIKTCGILSDEYLPTKNTICMKKYLENGRLICQINYASNGWQIIDSLAFRRDGNNLCIESYRPIYDSQHSKVKSYELANKNWKEKRALQPPLNKVNDKYNLCEQYLKDLQFLLERHPIRHTKSWQFEGGIVPSLMYQYGIPINEPLDSFSYSIDYNKINYEIFYFHNYTLTRQYKYDNRMLAKVLIKVFSKEHSSTTYYGEYFRVDVCNKQ